MRTYEASARTKEEAVELGLQELGVSIGDVDVTVVEEGSKGLFGLFGSRPVKVRLTVKESEEDPLGDLLEEAPAKKPERKPEKKAEKKPERKPEKKPEEKKAEEKKAEEKKPERKPEPRAQKKPEEKPAEAAETAAEEAPKAEIRNLEKPEITMIPAESLEAESPAGIAKEFLAELTKLMGVEVSIDMGTDAEGNVYGFMQGDTLGILIGRRGETLDALQYLTSLNINRGREEYLRVSIDTENYRAKREEALRKRAIRMAGRAKKSGRRVALEPMNPYERRILHSALQDDPDVTTHSEGEEPYRRVIITLK